MKIINKNILGTAILVASLIMNVAGPSMVFAATSPSLGTADGFAALAGSAITATTPSVVSGDVGLSPSAGSSYVGLTTGMVTGTIYAVDATGPAGAGGNNASLVNGAKTDLVTAYTNAAGQSITSTVPTELGSTTKTTGVFDSASGTFGITGTLTLDAQGDANAVFIFKTASTLITASSSSVVLINGAQACNVFWQVGSSMTLGTGSNFVGNALALSSITDNGGSTVNGRLLARNGAVTLNNTTVIKPTCVVGISSSAISGTGGCGTSSFAPLVNVISVPNVLTLPAGGGLVTYTYTAKNVGQYAMNNVVVTDNNCSSVNYVSGDVNNNGRLGLTETWIYKCTKNVSQTVTNTVTVHGSANCWDGLDIASSTVVVGLPIVPPLIHLVKTPNVFSLPAGGGAVTYNYAVTNPGTAPLHDVSITDDKCTGLPGRVVGHPGDLNSNNLLESNEIWQFTCLTNLTQTTTNIGTAEGTANGLTAIDISPATVVVNPIVVVLPAPKLPNTGVSPQGNTISWGVVILASALMVALTSAVLVLKKKKI